MIDRPRLHQPCPLPGHQHTAWTALTLLLAVSGTEWVPIEEPLELADDRGRLSVAPATLSQCNMTNILGLNQRQDEQGEQLDLVFPVFR